jgi:hypothetical protein
MDDDDPILPPLLPQKRNGRFTTSELGAKRGKKPAISVGGGRKSFRKNDRRRLVAEQKEANANK